MSISTTSGRSSSTSREALAAVAGLADHLEVGLAAEHQHERRPHQRVVVDDQHPDHHAAHGIQPCSTKLRPRGGARAGRRAARRARTARPGRAPSRGSRSPKPSGLRITTSRPSSGEPVSSIGQQRAGRVLAGVGDALLHDPVERPAGRVRHRGRRARPGRRSSTSSPDPRASSTSSPQVGVRRLRRERELAVGAAQHAEHAAQVGERLVRLLPDHRGAVRTSSGGEVLAERQRARRASRPARSGGRARRASRGRSGPARWLRAWATRSSCSASARSARCRSVHMQLAARADVHAPAEASRRWRRVDGEDQPERVVAAAGLPAAKNCAPAKPTDADQRDLAPPPPGGHRDRGQDRRAAGDRRPER